MSNQCLLFSGSHTFFQILLHWSLMPYFFPFLRHALDSIGKMKQYTERPIWLPCNSVDSSSIGKQKLCFFFKKIHAWKKKKKSMLEIFLKQPSDKNCTKCFCRSSLELFASIYLFQVPLVPACKQEGLKGTVAFPFPSDMARIPLHPHTCYSLS